MMPLIVIVAAASSGMLVAVTRWLARRWNLLDRPNERSSHVVPVPRLGGVAIVLVVSGGVALLGAEWTRLLVTAALALTIAGISAIDDVWRLPAIVRLAVHLCAATALIWWLGMPAQIEVGTTGLSLPPFVTSWLGLLWIAWFVNAFNFMDGIDGIAATQATVAGAGWLVLAAWAGVPAAALLAALVTGACLGFMWHNWSPARIFMGDAGSAFLGFVLAALPWLGKTEQLLLPGVLCVWPFAFDATYTLVRRASRGERVWAAHRSHLYQRLVIGGWSHARTASAYGVLAVFGVGAAIAVLAFPRPWVLGATALALVGSAAALVSTVKRVEAGR
jgi:UDP-N-acetylmuramyl pentapeptide phosphotransferase/UDP-N-acetylglucosamine-1-phosphate transferase